MILEDKKVKRKKMSEEEKKDWNELCIFVKKEILKYGDDTKFPRFLALRLKGLANGQYIVNNNQKLQGKYTFYEIKITFMYCKQDILYGFSKNVFKDENHKISYMMKIVESSLNTIRERLRSKQRQEERIEQIKVNTEESNIKYVNKNKDKNINNRLKGLI